MGIFGQIHGATLPSTDITTPLSAAATADVTTPLRYTDVSQWLRIFTLKDRSSATHTGEAIILGAFLKSSGTLIIERAINELVLSSPLILNHNSTPETFLCSLISSDAMIPTEEELAIYHEHGNWTRTYSIEGLMITHTPTEITMLSLDGNVISHPVFLSVAGVYFQTKSTPAEFENQLIQLPGSIAEDREREASLARMRKETQRDAATPRTTLRKRTFPTNQS